MGRWSQARRTGGGIPQLNFMVRARITDGPEGEATIDFAQPISFAMFPPEVLQSHGSGQQSTLYFPLAPTQLGVVFEGPITGDTSVTHTTTTPNFLSPQTIIYG